MCAILVPPLAGVRAEGSPCNVEPPNRATDLSQTGNSGCQSLGCGNARRDGYEWCDPCLDALLEGYAADFASEFGAVASCP